MAISGSKLWAGCGSEPVRRRYPETPPKVQAIHGATSGSPNSELIKALKKVCPPPLKDSVFTHISNFSRPGWCRDLMST